MNPAFGSGTGKGQIVKFKIHGFSRSTESFDFLICSSGNTSDSKTGIATIRKRQGKRHHNFVVAISRHSDHWQCKVHANNRNMPFFEHGQSNLVKGLKVLCQLFF